MCCFIERQRTHADPAWFVDGDEARPSSHVDLINLRIQRQLVKSQLDEKDSLSMRRDCRSPPRVTTSSRLIQALLPIHINGGGIRRSLRSPLAVDRRLCISSTSL